ncbi:MAG TPA: sigma-E factor negative regulatory protein [Gammaproteobacteria bacterium]|nr:sigma-E factor negative regulatory protein [Gammaproteobacteria bacterium]
MSEEIHDQVSAFMDDELSSEECAFLVRRLERDPDARSKLIRYSLVGSALRRELLQPNPDLLRCRIHEALNGTTPALTPVVVARSRWQRRLTAPAFGVGIAATVALASLFVVRTVNQAGGAAPAPTTAASLSSLVAPLAAENTHGSPSYVVPQDPPQSGSTVQAPIRLTNYLVHHGEFTSLLNRTWVYSTVVGGFDASIVDTAEDSAAPSTSSGAGAGQGSK